MPTTQSLFSSAPSPDPSGPSHRDAVRFWEKRRLVYNIFLATVAVIWILTTWPHFRPAATAFSLLRLSVLALLANVCYCAAYLLEVFLQRTTLKESLRKRRWIVWSLGTILAILFENYWIADEIYPFVK